VTAERLLEGLHGDGAATGAEVQEEWSHAALREVVADLVKRCSQLLWRDDAIAVGVDGGGGAAQDGGELLQRQARPLEGGEARVQLAEPPLHVPAVELRVEADDAEVGEEARPLAAAGLATSLSEPRAHLQVGDPQPELRAAHLTGCPSRLCRTGLGGTTGALAAVVGACSVDIAGLGLVAAIDLEAAAEL